MLGSLRTRLLLALAFALAPTIGAAQGRFDCRAHLEGYERVTFSDFSDLYDLSPFTSADGKPIDPMRLA
jgi:hypothetical protein